MAERYEDWIAGAAVEPNKYESQALEAFQSRIDARRLCATLSVRSSPPMPDRQFRHEIVITLSNGYIDHSIAFDASLMALPNWPLRLTGMARDLLIDFAGQALTLRE